MDARIKGHEEQLQDRFGVKPVNGIMPPLVSCSGSLKKQLEDMFTVLNNNILSGQFAWAKLEALEKEHKKALAGMANEFLSYY